MQFDALKVGELARRTGVTVRALHHYDEIGLLKPSLRTESGHRLYDADDIARLQKIISLRELGFSLEETQSCLDRPGFSPLEVIGLHVTHLQKQIRMEQELCRRLESLAAHLRTAGTVSADEFLQTIKVMTMMDKYYTQEQREYLKKRADEMGPERLRQGPQDWAELISLVRTEMEKGTNPASPQVQVLAKRWMDLVNQFTGGDPGIGQSLQRLWQEQGDNLAAQHGPEYDPRPVSEYIGKAIAAMTGPARS
jgi:DNA-binding transcriptional MerR regulator